MRCPTRHLPAALIAMAALCGCGDDGGGDGGGGDGGGMDASADADGAVDRDATGDTGTLRDATTDADAGGGTDSGFPARCLPQSVAGEGGGDGLLGIYWNGVECAELHGMACTGADCAEIYATLTECIQARRGCAGLCGPQEASPVGTECDLEFGPYWNGSSCDTFTGCDCAGVDCTRGYEDKDECELFNRSCLGKCEAQMAMGEGACEAILGVFWDGADCVTLGGCSCVGDDCGAAYESPELCFYAHRGCSP